MIRNQLRFRDLKARGVVDNWMTLNNWIDREGFPCGRLVGPNTRLWDESEVAAWLDARPTARKPVPGRRAAERETAA
jgi:predicted DNA-binding transcriptional regulator AlpA